MKKHNTVKVVLISLLVIVLLTWLFPAAYYQGQYVEQGRVQMGIFDLFSYPMTAIQYFGYVALYVLVVGGFYGVLYKIGAYRKVLDAVANTFKKNGKLSIAIIMVVLALLTSFFGLQLALLAVVPFLVAVILLMGYDKIVAALTVVGSTMIGIAGSTYAYSNTSVITSTLGLHIDSNLLVKLLILVLGLALLLFNTIKYIKTIEVNSAKKTTKKTTTKTTTKKSTTKKTDSKAATKTESVVKVDLSDYVPKETKTKESIIPMIITLCLVFVVMVLSFVSWADAFKNSAFTDATNAVKDFKIFGFALFGKILGNVKEFGSWTLTELAVLLIFASLILMVIYKIKFSDGFEAFVKGAKKAIEPAVLIVLIYTCLVATTYHPFQLVIYKAILGITKGFNVVTSIITGIFAGVFNVEPLYTFNSVIPYLGSIVKGTATYRMIAALYPAVYGVTMLVAPTSVVLMTVLSYLEVSYKEWFKNIWKLLVELFVLILVLFLILSLV